MNWTNMKPGHTAYIIIFKRNRIKCCGQDSSGSG